MQTGEWRKVGRGERPRPKQSIIRFSDGRLGLLFQGADTIFDFDKHKYTQGMDSVRHPVPMSAIVSTKEGYEIGFSSEAPGLAIIIPSAPNEDGEYTTPADGWTVRDTGGLTTVEFDKPWDAITGLTPTKLIVDYYKSDDNSTIRDVDVDSVNPFDGLNGVATRIAQGTN